ncbi:MAG: hypothetical protein R3B74_16240 [Nitrospirales bacterium]|nr:hypothetical protein [Nitrospirales bacterium]
MQKSSDTIDAAIREVTNARLLVSKIKTNQVRGVDAIGALKATALAWFNTHRPIITDGIPGIDLAHVDQHYTTILKSTARHAARQTYLDALRDVKNGLVGMLTTVLTEPAITNETNTDDIPPDFSPLAGNPEMCEILARRWQECCRCVNAEAHLASIVMMGGLLEALFVARANKMSVKDSLINAASAPKDKITGKTLNYQEWMLDSYIKVAHELRWITESARGVADVLKEYRNYVHPEKERRHGIVLTLNDSTMFWSVTKALVRQLLMSTTTSNLETK